MLNQRLLFIGLIIGNLLTACTSDTNNTQQPAITGHARIPLSAQLLASLKTYDGLQVKITVDKGTSYEESRFITGLKIDTTDNSLVGDLSLVLTKGLHTIELTFFLSANNYENVQIASLTPQTIEVFGGDSQVLTFTPEMYTYDDPDHDKFNSLREIQLGNDPADPASHPALLPPVADTASGAYNTSLIVQLSCGAVSPLLCAQIHYSLDGSAPTASSPVYTSPLNIDATTALQAIVTDIENNESAVASFTYTLDTRAPAVIGNTPSAGAELVLYTNPVIDVTFDEAVDCSSLNANTFIVTGRTGKIPGQVTCQGDKSEFYPDNGVLPASSLVDVLITTAARDLAHNNLAENYTWRFTTQPWTRRIGTIDYEHVMGSFVDDAGDVYVTGDTRGAMDGNSNHGMEDMFLTKIGADGVRRWTLQRGTGNYDAGTAVAVDVSGNVYVAGDSQGSLDGNTSSGDLDVFLMKFDRDGVWQWTRQLGTSGSDYVSAMALDGNGNVYITGPTYGAFNGYQNAGNQDYFLIKFDTAGGWQWTYQNGTPGYDPSAALAVDNNGNLYLTGATNGALDGNTGSGNYDVFLSKFDANGARLWTRLRGTAGSDGTAGIALDAKGNILVAGTTGGGLDGNISAGAGDIFMMQFDNNGVWQWSRQRGSTLNDSASALLRDSKGGLYIAGTTYGNVDGNTSSGGTDMILIKYDNAGLWQWSQQRGSNGAEYIYTAAISYDDFVYVGGDTDAQSTFHGNAYIGGQDVFVMKFDTGGSLQ